MNDLDAQALASALGRCCTHTLLWPPAWKMPCVHARQAGLCPELRCDPWSSLWLSLEFHEDQARPCIAPPSGEKRGGSPSFPAW